MNRNGIKPPAYDKPTKCIHDALAGGTYEPPIAPLPAPTRNFRSRPDAVEIPKSEIRNFVPLTERDANRFGDAYTEAVWGKDWSTDNWPNGDIRWTLTPAQLRKLNSKKAK